MIEQKFILTIKTNGGVNPDKLTDYIFMTLAQYGYWEHNVSIKEYNGKRFMILVVDTEEKTINLSSNSNNKEN